MLKESNRIKKYIETCLSITFLMNGDDNTVIKQVLPQNYDENISDYNDRILNSIYET